MYSTVRRGVNIHTRCKRSKTVTQIGNNEYLIEGETDFIRFGCEIDPIITYADIDGGPLLHVGKDFFGKGRIVSIQNIDSGRDGYIMIKVILNEQNN